jgi:hypothetical protein
VKKKEIGGWRKERRKKAKEKRNEKKFMFFPH